MRVRASWFARGSLIVGTVGSKQHRPPDRRTRATGQRRGPDPLTPAFRHLGSAHQVLAGATAWPGTVPEANATATTAAPRVLVTATRPKLAEVDPVRCARSPAPRKPSRAGSEIAIVTDVITCARSAAGVCVVKALKNRGKNTPAQTPVVATMTPTAHSGSGAGSAQVAGASTQTATIEVRGPVPRARLESSPPTTEPRPYDASNHPAAAAPPWWRASTGSVATSAVNPTLIAATPTTSRRKPVRPAMRRKPVKRPPSPLPSGGTPAGRTSTATRRNAARYDRASTTRTR